MSKIIDSKANNWFQEVAPRAYYSENDLERVIMHNLRLIFPEYIAVIFKDDLLNRNTGKSNRADLCMIKNDYSEWYVIEVELGIHTKSEVVKQIDTFRNCNYTVANANYIYKKNTSAFIQSRLTTLVTTIPPELMVIVNEVKKDWKSDLTNLNCKMCVFQIYNDFGGNRMFRLNGEHPFIYTNFCNCTFEKQLPYAIKILGQDFLASYGITHGMKVNIEFNGVRHIWKREDDGNEVFLICNSPISPLDSLAFRYRLNFYKTGWIKPVNLFQNIYNKIFDKQQVLINNSFSFTKE